MHLRFHHVFSRLDSSFPFSAKQYSIGCTSLFTHTPNKGHLGCFQVLAIMIKAAINIEGKKRFNAIPMKIQAASPGEINILILKIIWKCKRLQMGRTIMRQNKVGQTILCAYTACFHDLTIELQ